MVAAPHPHRAARSSSPHAALISPLGTRRPAPPRARRRPARNGAGEEIRGDGVGGGDPPEMGQGEEIRWRWTREGDPPEMGQGEDSRRPAGVLGGGGAVASHRKKKTAPVF
jgi:hypothetical protein